jgi:hypothetical protein
MTCNYNKNLPHIQIRSHPKSKIGNFSSSNPITTDYAKSKWSGLGANVNVEIRWNGQVVSGQDNSIFLGTNIDKIHQTNKSETRNCGILKL